MAGESLQPTARGWWEKAYAARLFIGLAMPITAIVAVILKQLDFWSYLAIAIGTSTKREVADPEMGIVECGIRSKSLPLALHRRPHPRGSVGLWDMPGPVICEPALGCRR